MSFHSPKHNSLGPSGRSRLTLNTYSSINSETSSASSILSNADQSSMFCILRSLATKERPLHRGVSMIFDHSNGDLKITPPQTPVDVPRKTISPIPISSSTEHLDKFIHDINTVTHVILGYSELMKMSHPTDKHVSNICSAAQQLSNLVSNISNFSETKQIQSPISREVINPQEMLNDCIDMFSIKMREKKLTYTRKFDDNVAYICAKKDDYKRLIMNIISNAVKYNKPNGTIHFTENVSNDTTPAMYTLHVRDEGIGIFSKDINTVFKARTRLANDGNGKGLGLTISKDIATALNGTITVQSPGLGRGTTVTVKLPIKRLEQHRFLATSVVLTAETAHLKELLESMCQTLNIVQRRNLDDAISYTNSTNNCCLLVVNYVDFLALYKKHFSDFKHRKRHKSKLTMRELTDVGDLETMICSL
jgi:nitrogen-specific signal transduction histidine kinase